MRKQGPIRRGLSIKRWGQRLAQHLRLWVPAFALGHAHIWCGGLTQVLLGDSRIGDPCDFYCDTSALAEVSACWRKLTGRWVGSGIVVSIKGGGAHRMHGRG